MSPRFILILFAWQCLAQSVPSDPPYKHGRDWKPLLNGSDLSGWHGLEGKSNDWFTTREVLWDRVNPAKLTAQSVPGGIIVNGAAGRTSNLVTDSKFGDVELYLEFLISKGSNSGVYLHGLYEVQILDSYGVANPGVHDCGAIYERWIDNKGAGGSPPSRNASLPPGEWQSFHITFRAPRFDPSGAKMRNATFLSVIHNGIQVQKNVPSEGPTRAGMDIPESRENPLMLQGDHGPVAFRNIYIRPLRQVP
jgi:3-keto-disaccharide hydrolase